MAQTQTMPSAAFEHERCKPNAACAQKVIPVIKHVTTDEDIGLVQVCDTTCVVEDTAINAPKFSVCYVHFFAYGNVV